MLVIAVMLYVILECLIMKDRAKSQQQFSANRSSILHEQSQKHTMEISNASKQLLHRVANKKEAELRNELFGRVSVYLMYCDCSDYCVTVEYFIKFSRNVIQ